MKRILTIFADQAGVPLDEVKYDSRLVEDLEGDSLDAAELVIVIEEEFNIEINNSDEEDMTLTPNGVREYLQGRDVYVTNEKVD